MSAALLAAGVDVRATTDDGATAAHLAAQHNDDPAVVQVLVVAEVARPASTTIGGGANGPATRPGGNAGQLPPEILVDRHLVRVERLLSQGDHGAAYAVMVEVVDLQEEHELQLPPEFHFQQAQVAMGVDRPEVAIASLNDYLLAAGRDGRFYRDALRLLDAAEEEVRRLEAERQRVEVARQQAEEEPSAHGGAPA